MSSATLFDVVHKREITALKLTNTITSGGSKFWHYFDAPADITNKCLRIGYYVDSSQSDVLGRIDVFVGSGASGEPGTSSRATSYIRYTEPGCSGWRFLCLAIDKFVDEAGDNFDPTNVTCIGFRTYVHQGETGPFDLYVSDLDFCENMKKPGVVIIVDNFNSSVPAMADYAASKGVKLNLSIIPGVIGGTWGGQTQATLEQIQSAARQGHFIWNHTMNHITTDISYKQTCDEVTEASKWMEKNGFSRGAFCVSNPSSFYNDKRNDAYFGINTDIVYHHWTQYSNPETSDKILVSFPYFPAERMLNISVLDWNDWKQSRKDACIASAAAAMASGGVAVLGFHGTAWEENADLWKELVDDLAAVSGIYFYGIDELVEGTYY